MNVLRIHRITVAVQHADTAGETFAQLFGVEAAPVELVREFGVRSVDVPLGEALLQLVSPSPIDPENAVRRFLQRKGEGFYNVALEVEDLEAAIAELAQKGVRVSAPVEAEVGMRSAFVTMAATHGLSVQLVEVLEAGGGKRVAGSGTREAGRERREAGRGTREAGGGDDAPTELHVTSTPHPAALGAADWADAGAPVPVPRAATAAAATPVVPEEAVPPPPLLDLTPDEWSDDD